MAESGKPDNSDESEFGEGGPNEIAATVSRTPANFHPLEAHRYILPAKAYSSWSRCRQGNSADQ